MDDSRLPPVDEDAAHLRRQLIIRGAVAVGLIVVLLAALVLFERKQSTGQPPEPAPVAKTISPIGPSLSTGMDSQSAAVADQSAGVAKQLPDGDGSRTGENKASLPIAEPEESADPTTNTPDALPPSPRTTSGKAPRLVVEQSSAKAPPPKAKAPLPVAASAPKPATLPPPSSAPVVPAFNPGNGFFVQLGVFSNPANAEELRARLDRSGISAHVETRVQLGPFKTRQEALAAQEKLRKLGLDTGMLITPKK